ncbi:hypothetical protein [Arcticibacterium luteifluviistationis]|uniref:Uncharacterized protein n=1 Tax=Arcticibacterium luteifluviistationis TaxID=1784714 RepID=A0A2Z4GGD1_9BACT|nr:hypothetical protein [Arcticibacterium luteifluviistationis]AWW00460.1 hypothetical protein DJ013_20675 [Arcticibacterium luteifluviistationis]
MVRIILFAILIPFFYLSSCSKSDEPNKESNVTGSWSGIIVQPEFGELLVGFSINNTTLNGQTGTGTFTSGDISVCDPSQFNCTPLACSFNLSTFSMSGNFYEIDQIINKTNTTCGDGTFEVTALSENSIKVVWFEEAFPENRATGTLTRQ